MTKEARLGLKASLQEFGDISGIVWNKRSNELIGGNHRWEEIQKLYEGKELELKQIPETDLFVIYADGEFTSYTLREVDWGEEKAAAANLTANNQNIAGYFTKEVDDILKAISSFELFSDLKLGELYIDIPVPEVNNVEEHLFGGDDSDESMLLDDSGYGESVDIHQEDEPVKCNKAEITIVIEGDIDLNAISEELRGYLNAKYKVSFLNASST